MAKWRQSKVDRVIVVLEGIVGSVKPSSGLIGDFDGTVDGVVATFTPRSWIVKAERALKLLFEPPGPLSSRGDVPKWLKSWTAMREDADPAVGRLRVVVDATTCTDESVFDPTLTHRLLFRRHFHGRPNQTVNWLMANPIGGDTNDGRRPTLGKIRNLSFAWGHGTVLVTNLFTVRTRDIDALARFDGAVNHPDADAVILDCVRAAGGVVLACGNATHDLASGRYREVLGLLRDNGMATYAVAPQAANGSPLLTGDGRPVHPRVLPPRAFRVPFGADFQ